MLSYKHEFHAGNHADVVKHIVWVAILDSLKKEDQPYSIIDTHAAAGIYDLTAESAAKNKKYLSGISKLLNEQSSLSIDNELLNNYISLTSQFFNKNQYPGSPFISLTHSREGDQIHLAELQPEEFTKLSNNCHRFEREKNLGIHLQQCNGLDALVAMVPPTPNRGAILIDPPYEQLAEYREVQQAVNKTLQQWQAATLAIWYPLLSKRRGPMCGAGETMVKEVITQANTAINVTFTVDDKANDSGMYGSGMCILNPPESLNSHIEQALTAIMPVFGSHAHSEVTWLKPENN